jgi:beta-mannanase
VTGTPAGADKRPAERPAAHTAQEPVDPRFGIFTDGAPYDGNVDAIDRLQGKLGRHIDIVNWYQNWADGSWAREYHPDVVAAVTGSGRTPLLTWEPWDPAKGADQPQFRLRRIVDGAFDDYIASWADSLRDAGGDVYLRPMHEMNGDWYPWGGTVGDNSAELYIKAWRHMVGIFRDHGARNVKFVWCPLPFSVPDTKSNQLEAYYPGTRYVDVLSLDGYNWGSRHADYGGWQSFKSIFGAAYKRLTKLGPQPIWIAEVGSAPQGGDKAAWVRDMWRTARTMPRLKALVWFDQNKEEDWRALPVASAFAAKA